MKKILCLLLIFSLNMGIFSVFAKNGMEDALTAVKIKVDIPQELSEFSNSVNTYKDKTTYNFSWYTPERNKEISVTSDVSGIITSYSMYSDDFYNKSKKAFPSLDKGGAKLMAENFVKQVLPEAFSENDFFAVSSCEAYMSDRGTNFYVYFIRKKNDIKVYGQTANVEIISVDGINAVTLFSTNFKKDISYEEEKSLIADYESKYKISYPIELIYEKEKYDSKEYSIIYRFLNNKKGYISAYDGEIRELSVSTGSDDLFLKNESMSDSLGSSASGKPMFTEAELKELEINSKLITEAEIKSFLKNEKEFSLTDKMVLDNLNYYKNEEKYFVNANFREYDENKKSLKSLSISMNALTGELLSYNYNEYDKEYKDALPEKSEITICEEKAEKFISEYSQVDKKDLKKEEIPDKNNNIVIIYSRLYDSVKVNENNIRFSYDAKTSKLISYSKNFQELEFESKDGIISEDEAYETVLKRYPLVLTYVNTGDFYSLCYTPDTEGFVKINAHGGDDFVKNNPASSVVYTDIENHWCKDYVLKLKDFGIYLTGDELEPDKNISQLDMLRLFASTVFYTSYNDYTADDLYNRLIRDGIIGKEDRADDNEVKRKDAFKYLVNMCGYGEIAQIKGIFKTNFADEGEISPEYIGYTSILSGLGVIKGNGEYVYPEKELTRAEALIMVYNYLK